MIRLRSSFVSFWVLVFLLSAAAWAVPPPGSTPEPNWVLIDAPSGTEIASEGEGPPAPSEPDHLYILRGDAGVSESPLPDAIKEDLLAIPLEPGGPGGLDGVAGFQDVEDIPMDGEESVYIVGQEIVEGIEASEIAGELTPEIEAIAEPLDEEVPSSSSSAVAASLFGGSCAGQEKTVNRVINLNSRTWDGNFDLDNGFSGSYTLTGQLEGSITVEVKFEIKRKKVIAWCVPYGAKLKTIRAFGNATSTEGITLTGNVEYHKTFGPEEMTKPNLFRVVFYIGPIPVTVGANMPITTYFDVDANLTGTINYNGTHVATGSFDYTCTLSNCTGSSSFDNTPVNGSDQQITGSVEGRVNVTTYVDVAFRAYLYADWIAYAQVGARPHLLGDLWGFLGNNCGDADGDGHFETVRALTFDLDQRLDWTAKSSLLGSDSPTRTIRTGTTKHVSFFDLLANSDAMQPQLLGPGSLEVDTAGDYQVRMRPCWPYTDQVTYLIDWGDGSLEELQGAPGTEVAASHTWSQPGSPRVTVTSDRDQHGRLLDQDYSRTIEVTQPDPLTLTVTPSPSSSIHGNAITWTATATGGSPASIQYALFRRPAGAAAWIPDVTAPVWQAGNVLTWIPGPADVGVWEIIVWVKDGHTSATANTYGFAAYANAGPVQVVAPLALSCTVSQQTVTYGNPVTRTISSTGGVPGTVQYTLSRNPVGTTNYAPLAWQTGTTLSWTPTASDLGTWQVSALVKDANTPASPGYATYCNLGQVTVVAPIALAITPSPASSVHGNAITWTATASGGTASSMRYALFRRRAGTTPWTPDVTAPAWQTGNLLSWTPGAADVGTWEIIVWVKDGNTPANANTYGYAAYANAGPVQVVTPPLTLSVTGSPAQSTYGNPISWTATAGGGTPSTTRYALFRRRAGTAPWIPDVTAPAWQTSNVLTWTPGAADAGTWEIVVWVKDGDTPATMNTYGFAAYANAGPVQVLAPLAVTVTPSPASVTSGNAVTVTATATGGDTASIQYTLARRRSGTTAWLPSPLVWQTSNVLSWTPGAADVGTWELAVGVKDRNTPPNPATYGAAAYAFPGTVQVVAPLTLSITPSPASSVHGNAITWTATASGGVPASTRYALFRRRAGATAWIPDVTAPVWQTGNVLSWTPAAADVGTWEIVVWVKDGNTPANMNTYGFAAYANAGPVQVVTPPLTLTGTGSPASATYGTTITWTATAGGGTPSTTRYALFRRRAGTAPWTPDVTAPAWQTSNVLSWTPASADVGTWEIVIWVKDGDTPANMNTYGFAAYYNAGPVQIVAPLSLTVTPSPASVNYGTTITWTATASGGVPSTTRYAFFRRRAGTAPWIPDVTTPNWQTSNVYSWTPTSADAGTWDTYVWVKDGNTPATMNTYGYAAGFNTGGVRVVAPLSGLSCSGPSSGTTGNTFTWSANASGGDSVTLRYAFFRRRAGTTPWTPDINTPAWQSSNVFSWTPSASEAGTWDIAIWAKDGNTANPVTCARSIQIFAPLTVTGTGSPSSVSYGNTITWTANASGGSPSTIRYALFRRRAGTTPWTPDVTAPAWQTSPTMSWTPASADTGTWEIIIWVKDGNTPANMNTYGFAAYYNAGPVNVTAPAPLTVTGTGSPSTSPAGTTITWTATASGGVPSTVKYALFRRKAGTSNWIPDVTAPSWQTSRTLSWTPSAADAGTWEIIIWVKDINTSPTQNGYGFAAYYNAQPVQVY